MRKYIAQFTLAGLLCAGIVAAKYMQKPNLSDTEAAKKVLLSAGYYCTTDSTTTTNRGGGYMVSKSPITREQVVLRRSKQPPGCVWLEASTDTKYLVDSEGARIGVFQLSGDEALIQELAKVLE